MCSNICVCVCACCLFEVLWNLFIFRARVCVRVFFLLHDNKNNFKQNCSFEPIFHSLHLKLRHSQHTHTYLNKTSIELECFSLALAPLENSKLMAAERMKENERDECYDKSFLFLSSLCMRQQGKPEIDSEWEIERERSRGRLMEWKICSMFAFMTHFFWLIVNTLLTNWGHFWFCLCNDFAFEFHQRRTRPMKQSRVHFPVIVEDFIPWNEA